MKSSYEINIVDAPSSRSVQQVRNVYCIGRNYADHARELGNEVPSVPIVFLKTTTSLRPLATGDLAYDSETFHHEAELVVLVGEDIKLGEKCDWRAVSALGLGLDLTRREVQNQLKAKGLPWTAAKSFAGSGLLSDFVEKDRFPDLDAIQFRFTLNNRLCQQGDTRLMLNSIPALLTHLAASTSLVPGDIVFTGTPAGVGPIRRGDVFALEFTQPNIIFNGKL
ncbi:MAG: fumarylacetoacetate hydrolase family protein [Proteobacteria bacterium]|nr:fumarylacetoacetate hydrolase family protein [Pseudomonadota bacterium]